MLVGRCLVFGEPYGRAVPVEHLARQLEPFSDAWPPDANFIDRRSSVDGLTHEWIANLAPPLEDLLRAHVAWFDALFRAPAERLGYARWGFKEVRLGIEHARYLRFVFPRARFLLLIRDPYAAFRSFKGLTVAYRRWPDEPVDTPERFGRHWRRLAEGFLEGAQALGGRVLRYEDVCAPSFDPRPVEDYRASRSTLAPAKPSPARSRRRARPTTSSCGARPRSSRWPPR